MNKDEFYIKLANSLQGTSLDEQQKVLDYFDELISDRMESGMTEEESVASLGDPEKLAKEALSDLVQKQELPLPKAETTPASPVAKMPSKDAAAKPAPKKKKRRWLRAVIALAIIFTVLGCLAVGAAYFYAHSTRSTRLVHLDANMNTIIFDSSSGDLRIVVDEARAGTVEFKETVLEKWSVLQTGETVYIDQESELGFGLFDTCCTVYVSNEMLETVTAETFSGDVFLEAAEVRTVKVTTSSGDVDLRGKVDVVNVHTSSGDIEMSASYWDATLVSASGDVELNGCCGANLSVETRSGEVEGTYRASAADCTINVRSTSGEIEIPRGSGRKYVINITTTSGDIEVDFIP